MAEFLEFLLEGFMRAAAVFSSRCATVEVPGIGSIVFERLSSKARRAAAKAQEAAEAAHVKASEAVREQINFALKRAAKEAVASPR